MTQSGLTVGDLIHQLSPEIAARRDVPQWPPDVFAIAAAILQRSGAYTEVVQDWPPDSGPRWNQSVGGKGRAWRSMAARGAPPLGLVARLWKTIRKGDGVLIDEVRLNVKLTQALVEIIALADEACEGVGIVGSPKPDDFEMVALPLLLTKESKTLCREIHPSRAIVLPKAHTPQTGITIRSLTHHLAFYLPGEVTPMWWMQSGVDAGAWCMNVLILPWPRKVAPMHFRAADPSLRNMHPQFGFFDCNVREPDEFSVADVVSAWKLAKEQLARAEGDEGARIHMIVFPELALKPEEPLAIMKATGATVVGGVREPIDDKTCRNCAAVAIPPVEVTWKQDKHHRWKLDGSQIKNYGIGSRLDPARNWWENMPVQPRQLQFFAIADWLTFSVLICEDLARLDPVTELLRAVAPNLVVALLLDGPQLASRWPARYATVLADDPGSSVLTVTSLGMASSSVPPGKTPSRVIALWKDARSAAPEEIALEEGALGVVMNLRREFVEEFTADGRGDHATTGYLLRNKVHQIMEPPRPPKPSPLRRLRRNRRSERRV